MSTNYEAWQRIATESPDDSAVVNEGVFYRYGSADAPANNPFQLNNYDFDAGFYQGEFDYTDPLTQQPATGTPERYGRQRIAAFLSASVLTNLQEATMLDIGSGTADIVRALPAENRADTHAVLADISGPWTNLSEESLLVKGWNKLRMQSRYASVTNIQFDLNTSAWPFKREAFDYIASNMALHHIQRERKDDIAESLYASLKPGGLLMVTDVFDYNRDRIAFTRAGDKGPEECSGSPEPIWTMLERLCRVGFTVSGPNVPIAEEEALFSPRQLDSAVQNLNYALPINRAVWYFTAQKLGE